MIAREVRPARLSRLAILSLIALVASLGAVLCASFVAGERDAGPALAGSWSETGPLTAIHAESSIGYAYGVDLSTWTDTTPKMIFSSPRQAAWFGIGSFLLASDVTTADGAHHDTAVCIGNTPRCVYFEAATP